MKFIRYQIKNHTGWLEFNRPGKHNAFHKELLLELNGLLERENQNPGLHSLVITGYGDKAFSSGVDLNALTQLDSVEKAREFAMLLEDTSEKIFRFSKPTLALINGIALGGGLGFATAADIRIMSTEAKIGYPAVKLGAILPATCTLYLNALIGKGKAMDLLLTGKMLTADEALDAGLVNYIYPPQEIKEQTLLLSEKILEGGHLALNYTKRTVNYSLQKEIESAKIYAADNFAFLSQTVEWKKRINAFAQRKKMKKE